MMNYLSLRLAGLAALLFSLMCGAAEKHHKVQQFVIPYQVEATDNIHFYVVEVLRRALTVTQDEYGPFALVAQQESTVQSRQLRNLNSGLSDIVWVVSNTQRDYASLPVRIPIIGGLYGYRVLLVNDKFAASVPRTLTQLQRMTFTQGPDWPDLAILRANNLQVKASPYRAGFRLVRGGFIDAYPRAAHEAVLELDKAVGRDLAIAPDIMLEYPNPLFFHVAKNNEALAERLRKGVSQLIERGELQQLLEAQDFYTAAMKVMQNRNVLPLQNPYLSPLAKQAVDTYLMRNIALRYEDDVAKAPPCPAEARQRTQ